MSRFQEYIESDQGPEDLCKEIEQLNKRLADAYSIQEENADLQKKYEKALETLNNRETFINWVNEHYPEIVKEYLGFESISMYVCKNQGGKK